MAHGVCLLQALSEWRKSADYPPNAWEKHKLSGPISSRLLHIGRSLYHQGTPDYQLPTHLDRQGSAGGLSTSVLLRCFDEPFSTIFSPLLHCTGRRCQISHPRLRCSRPLLAGSPPLGPLSFAPADEAETADVVSLSISFLYGTRPSHYCCRPGRRKLTRSESTSIAREPLRPGATRERVCGSIGRRSVSSIFLGQSGSCTWGTQEWRIPGSGRRAALDLGLNEPRDVQSPKLALPRLVTSASDYEVLRTDGLLQPQLVAMARGTVQTLGGGGGRLLRSGFPVGKVESEQGVPHLRCGPGRLDGRRNRHAGMTANSTSPPAWSESTSSSQRRARRTPRLLALRWPGDTLESNPNSANSFTSITRHDATVNGSCPHSCQHLLPCAAAAGLMSAMPRTKSY